MTQMAMIQHTQTAAGLSLSARFSNLVEGFKEARARRRLFKETLRELNGLSTRELNDLGLSRSMITRVAYEAAYGN